MDEFIESLGAEVYKQQFADSPQLLLFLEANLCGVENAAARDQLLQAADESSFSLRQWVDSLRSVQAWLGGHSLEMSLEDQIGYVCCASESAGAGANLTYLSSQVADMLEAYGCERAVRRTACADGEGGMANDEK